ncbi:aldo/keto reductase [soil metagenome]
MTNSIGLPAGGQIPLLGFGTWQLPGPEAYDPVRIALDVGYRHLDTATMYRNEADIGRALRDSGVPRSEVFLTTKLPPDRVSDARATLEQSLSALGVDAVDLWLLHWPPSDSVAAWESMLALRDEGLATEVGVSNFDPSQVDELVAATGQAPAVNQIKWSPARFDRARLEHSRAAGVVLEGYSPFRSGTLEDPVLAEIASRHRRTPAQVVLRWHLEHGVVVIPKSARRERIEANFDIVGFELDPDEVARIDALGS